MLQTVTKVSHLWLYLYLIGSCSMDLGGMHPWRWRLKSQAAGECGAKERRYEVARVQIGSVDPGGGVMTG